MGWRNKEYERVRIGSVVFSELYCDMDVLLHAVTLNNLACLLVSAYLISQHIVEFLI